MINCILNGKDTINHLIAGLIKKKDIIKMREYFPKSNSLGANVKVELDLSNFTRKIDL